MLANADLGRRMLTHSRYGDGHMPYNPSPFAKFVDGRHLNATAQARMLEAAAAARRAAGVVGALGMLTYAHVCSCMITYADVC